MSDKKEKKAFLDKWQRWLDRGINRYIALATLCLICILLLFISIFNNIGKLQVQGLYPGSKLTVEKVEYPGFTLHKDLAYKALFPKAGYECYLPTSSEIKDNSVIGYVDDIMVVAVSSADEEATMVEKTLHLTNLTPILGASPKARLELKDSGYFYDKRANYYAYTVTTKISTRKQVAYTMCYVLAPEGKSERLYLYVSTTDKEKIAGAYNLLWDIVLSVNVVEDIDAAIKEYDDTDGEPGVENTPVIEEEDYTDDSAMAMGEYQQNGYYRIEGGYEIYVCTELENSLEDGVFHIYWTNTLVSPYELYIEDIKGNKYYPYMEYTNAGNYVFYIGAIDKGDVYYLKGSTPTMFENCNYYFLEMEQYELLFGNNKIMIPHEG